VSDMASSVAARIATRLTVPNLMAGYSGTRWVWRQSRLRSLPEGRPSREWGGWRTTMRSASPIVDRRCAMMRVVRRRMSRRSVSSSVASVAASSALVGSPRMRMGASLRNARAMDSHCRWPPESVTPRSPMAVS
jgi:hypothetical protein